MRSVFEKMSIDRWAIALDGCTQEYRSKLDAILDEKEQYMINAYVSQLQNTQVDEDLLSQLREEIGLLTGQVIQFNKNESEQGNVSSEKAA